MFRLLSHPLVPRRPSRTRPRARVSVVLGAWFALVSGGANAAELIVVDQAGCPYCERFEAEIAPAWANTDEGRRAPLRRVDLHTVWPADLADVRRATVTPTFILVDDGREIDRLVGYPGDEHFWFLIGEVLAQLEAGEGPGSNGQPGSD